MARFAFGGVALSVAVVLLAAAAPRMEQPFVRDARVEDASVRVMYTPPRSSGPGLGPAHAAFLDERHGFVATTGGGGYVPRTGYVGPMKPAEVDVTRDGGANWRTLWRGRRVVFDAVAAADRRHVYAWGSRLDRSSTCCSIPLGRAFILASEDGGRSWRIGRAPLTPRSYRSYPGEGGVVLQALGPRSLAVDVGGRAARSDDGGRSWRRVSAPRGANVIRFASASVAYAGGSCLWRTRDGGRSWQRLAVTCGPPVRDIHAVGARVAVAQSSNFDAFEPGLARSVVRLSLDGGSTWRVVARVAGADFWKPSPRSWPSVRGVYFADARHGWALSSERIPQQQYYVEAAHVTTDGGRTWRKASGALPVAFVGTRHAWVGGAGIWRTVDAGRTWRASVRPEYVGPSSPLFARGRRLIVIGAVGTLETRDGGRTWRPIGAPGDAELRRLRGELTRLRPGPDDYWELTYGYLRSGGKWRRLAPPTDKANVAVAGFTDPEHGVVVDGKYGYPAAVLFATSDGGGTWRRVRVPPGVQPYTHSVVAPGIIAILATPLLYVSLDEGRHWQRFRYGPELSGCGVATRGEEAWLACGGPNGDAATVLLRTDDGGHSWMRVRTPFPLNRYIQLTGPGEAWTASSAVSSRWPHSLWHTRDGGRTWRQVWVTVPSRAVLLARR